MYSRTYIERIEVLNIVEKGDKQINHAVDPNNNGDWWVECIVNRRPDPPEGDGCGGQHLILHITDNLAYAVHYDATTLGYKLEIMNWPAIRILLDEALRKFAIEL